MGSEQTDTEAIYREVVGEGFTPPEENETRKNGYARYKIYDNVVGRCLPCLKLFPHGGNVRRTKGARGTALAVEG